MKLRDTSGGLSWAAVFAHVEGVVRQPLALLALVLGQVVAGVLRSLVRELAILHATLVTTIFSGSEG